MTFTDNYRYVAIQLQRFRRKERKLKSLLKGSLAVLKSCGFQSGQGILSQQHSYRNNKTRVNNSICTRHTSFLTSECKNQRQKISFVQSKFMVPHALGFIIYALERKEGKPLLLKQTLRSRFTLLRTYESHLTCQHFIQN